MISNAWPQALSAVSVCNHKKDLGFFQIYMQDLLIKLALDRDLERKQTSPH